MVDLSTSYWTQTLNGPPSALIDRFPESKNYNQAIKQSSSPRLPVCPACPVARPAAPPRGRPWREPRRRAPLPVVEG